MAPAPTATGSSPDTFVQATLKQLKEQFFSSLEDGGSLLSLFQSSWAAFHDKLESLQDHLNPDTLNMIDSFAGTVDAVVSTLLELETSTSHLYEDFSTDLSQLLDEAASLPAQDSTATSPSYIEPALRWLKANTHNPYPSRSIRNDIARQTRSSPKDIDAWFVDVRKRIGWSRMRYSRFGNRKADIVDAATRFYNDSDPTRPLEQIIESEFSAISQKVDELYERCVGSVLATRLDQAVKDLTPEMKQILNGEKLNATTVSDGKNARRRRRPYPTPEPSPATSPEPWSECSSDDLPALILDRVRVKRSRSQSADCLSDDETPARPVKRIRSDVASPAIETRNIGLLSPAISVASDLADLPIDQPLSDTPTNTGKRKRTLSDTGVVRTAPHTNFDCDSTPNSANDSIDNWFNVFFSQDSLIIPHEPPTLNVELPPSAPLEVEPCTANPFFQSLLAFDTDSNFANPLPSVDALSGDDNDFPRFEQSWLDYPDFGSSLPTVETTDPTTGHPLLDGLHSDQNQMQSSSSPNMWALPMQTYLDPLPLFPPQIGNPSNALLPTMLPPITAQLALPSTPLPNVLSDKAKELLQLEAQCQALRAELAAAS